MVGAVVGACVGAAVTRVETSLSQKSFKRVPSACFPPMIAIFVLAGLKIIANSERADHIVVGFNNFTHVLPPSMLL
jgi:hypothetical protein